MNTKGSQIQKTSCGSTKPSSNHYCEKSLRCYINNLTKKTYNQESSNRIRPHYSSNPLLLLKPNYYSTSGLTIKTINFSSATHPKHPQILNSRSSKYRNTLTPSSPIIKNKLKQKSYPINETLTPSRIVIKTKLKQKTSPLTTALKSIHTKIKLTEDQNNLIGWE